MMWSLQLVEVDYIRYDLRKICTGIFKYNQQDATLHNLNNIVNQLDATVTVY